MSKALDGWTPLRIYAEDETWRVDWVWLERPLNRLPRDTSFYDFWLEGLLERPFNLLFRRQTGVEALLEAAEAGPGLPLAGLIPHMSRCGSTLVTRLLATDPTNLVLAEPYALHKTTLQAPPNPPLPDEVRIAWLRALVNVMGRPLAGSERRLFLKPNMLATLRLDLLLAAFPETPWVFLYRQPVEVLISQLRQPTAGALPGYLDPALFDSDFESVYTLPIEVYLARVLARICAAAAEALPGSRGLALNYTRLPQVVWQELAAHFNLTLDAAQVAAMQTAACYNAKGRAGEQFVPDSAAKQQAASSELHQLADVIIGPYYDRLEAISAGETTREDR